MYIKEIEERCYLAWGYCFLCNNSGRGAKTIVAHGVVEGMVSEDFFFVCFLVELEGVVICNWKVWFQFYWFDAKEWSFLSLSLFFFPGFFPPFSLDFLPCFFMNFTLILLDINLGP